jgi:hypothetical protein
MPILCLQSPVFKLSQVKLTAFSNKSPLLATRCGIAHTLQSGLLGMSRPLATDRFVVKRFVGLGFDPNGIGWCSEEHR